mmetsp:Transcript_15792/g.36563  ORF Transcript_15792/g.36563 Transcript_15792/m.36563 type:complete len:363 (-) Transcript_15792:316-1404(-)|eukprot:CAMPEP_0197184594 /NCGR_PEP_ID=MMETSP1423-20130617/10167_1 /TAXON_ID=476441 /ORGANISM="Pseudo-nitzschia heimii, Strain UNC1101" /LENGTH=362 /DNA_ID=CAMNT_0042635445 /DNA_START=344 /DNA_END=1432 /DNA_ORIENTATION=-
MSNSTNSSAHGGLLSRENPCRVVDNAMGTRSETESGVGNEKNCCQDGGSTAGAIDNRFSCNICFDEVVEPVVTTCGHLYCWPCLFQWLEPGMNQEERESLGLSPFRYGGRNPSRRVCPMSKSPCPLSAVIPVYVRSLESPSSRSYRSETKSENEVEIEINQRESDCNASENIQISNNGDNVTGCIDQGLRRRQRNQGSNNSNSNIGSVPIPNRPSVNRPRQHQEEPSTPPTARRSTPGTSSQAEGSTDNPHRVGSVQLTPRSPNGHNGSLANGIISSLQRATSEYYRSTNSTNEGRRIPSLHDRRNPLSNHNADGSGRFGGDGQFYSQYDAGNGNLYSETTQYLTRLLIMLTSFVIFCFLAV